MWFSGPTLVVLAAALPVAAANQLPPLIAPTGLIAGQPTNLLNGVICADGDRDGVDEIYWEAEGSLGNAPTLIYERRETTAAGEPALAPAVAPGFLIAPNPFAFETVLSGEAIGEDEAVGVYDLNGRRVHPRGRGSHPHLGWPGRRRAPAGTGDLSLASGGCRARSPGQGCAASRLSTRLRRT